MEARWGARWDSAQTVVYLFAIAMAAALGVGVVKQPIVAVGVVGVLVLALAFAYPYAGTVALVVGAFTVGWLQALKVVPSTSSLVLDALSLALLLAALVVGLRRDRRVGLPRGFLWAIAFVVVAASAALFNAVNWVSAVLALRALLRFVPLLVLPSVFEWTDRQSRRIVGLIVGLTLLQAPVALFEFLLKNTHSGDSVGGTLGGNGSGTVTALVIAVSILVAGFYLYRARGPLVSLLGVVVMCVPPALNETKVFFIAAPLIWAVMLAPRARQNVLAGVLIAAALAAGVTLAYQSYSAAYSSKLATQSGRESIADSELVGLLAKDGSLKRIPSIEFAAATISKSPQTFLLGYGPGAASTSELTGEAGQLINEYGRLLRNPVPIAKLLLEEGFVGLLCFVALIVTVFRIGLRLERQAAEPFWRATGLGLQGILVTFAALSWYTSTFNADSLACVAWAIGGVCALELGRLRRAVPASEIELPAQPA